MKASFLVILLFSLQSLSGQTFTELSPIVPFDVLLSNHMAFADIDGDEDLDVLIVGNITTNRRVAKLYLNEGKGSFVEVRGTPFEGVTKGAIAFADVDGDNDQDVIISGQTFDNHITKLYTNDGSGNFEEATGSSFEGVHFTALDFADVDGDDDQDILIVGNGFFGRSAILYINDGAGNFSKMKDTPFAGVFWGSLKFADVDGDDDQDVLIVGSGLISGTIAKLYINDGTGNFSEVSGTSFDPVIHGSISFADIDNDNDQDLLITGMSPSSEFSSNLYTNDGAGNFTNNPNVPFKSVNYSATIFADVDGDQDQDLLISGRSTSGNISELYINDGSGNFSVSSQPSLEDIGGESVTIADINGDGDQDVLINGITSSSYSNHDIKLFENDGLGNFSEIEKYFILNLEFSSIASADVDGDGDQDFLISGQDIYEQRHSKLYLNSGNGYFLESKDNLFHGVYLGSVAFSDIDGDGDPDALITGYVYGSPESIPIAKLYKNDGSGIFSEVQETTLIGVWQGSVAFEDVDGDNDSDLIMTGKSSATTATANLYINDGSGNFSKVEGTPFAGTINGSTAFADIDGDNDQDLLLTGFNNSLDPISKLYRNDGSGNFSEIMDTELIKLGQGNSKFSDVDADGDQDILITGRGEYFTRTTKQYLNDGTGIFTEVLNAPFEGIAGYGMAFEDIDNDGDEDCLISGYNNESEGIAKLYINDGTGNFSELTEPTFDGITSSSIVFADVDNDGDEDCLMSGRDHSGYPFSRIYLNNTLSAPVLVEPEPVLEFAFKLFPNPSGTNSVNIEYPSTEVASVKVKIFDLRGKLLKQIIEPTEKGALYFTLDIDFLTKGAYIIQLNDGQRNASQILLIQ